MNDVDGRYGPLEWRLPEAHAIYWAALGLEKAKLNPTNINQDELLGLRRVIYQSLHLAVLRGRLILDPFTKTVDLGPNLGIISKANAAYEQAMAEDEKFRDHISRAHRNMVADIVYYLYAQAREADAAQWFKYLAQKYPDKPLFTGDAYSLPTKLTLDEYAVGRVQADINESSRDHVKAALEGLLANSYRDLAIDEDEHAAGFTLLARKVWTAYQARIKGREGAVGLPPFEEIDRDVLNRLLNSDSGLPADMVNRLRTKLGLPASTNEPSAGAPGR
jgi:hypothetical protein